MQDIFIAIILIMDVQTGLPVDVATVAFEDLTTCQTQVTRIIDKVAGDFMVYAEGACVASVLIKAE